MPLQATSGAASYDAFGGGVAAVPQYIEDVFSTWLYTGTGSAQTITNGIDLAGKGGLVWNKIRNLDDNHYLIDTTRGVTKALYSNATDSQATITDVITSFNSNGFTAGTYTNGYNNVSWTFRKQPKFFDVITWTGDGTGNGRRLPHNLGSVPGCMIFKRTNIASNWAVWHRTFSNPTDDYLNLNLTNAVASFSNNWGTSAPTATDFPVGSSNASGGTYVAYLFAHNAGGFGLTGTDNVISCGSFTTDGSGNSTVTLGYEPQWIIAKPSSEAGSWRIYDNMRGMNLSRTLFLNANNSDAEFDSNAGFIPNATGFTTNAQLTNPSATYIYIAIRRGPMRTPTTGTSVFSPVAATTGTQTTGFPIDMMMQFWRTSNDIYANTEVVDRLRGVSSNSTAQSRYLLTTSTGAEDSLGSINASLNWTNTGFDVPPAYSGGSNGFECFRRAPGFFDEVCYTGSSNDDATQTLPHNLTVVPELMIVKRRSGAAASWQVYSAALPASQFLVLNGTGGAAVDSSVWNATVPNASTFTIGTKGSVNLLGATYVNYLFATCPGVSKCLAFTGTGTLQTINCGFTGGARFVLIKRTDSTGNWFVWDSSRGLSSSNDPYLMLNSTAAEVTSTNWVDTTATGFQVTAASGNDVNINGASYIALAIA